jgi:hypothetical protein
MVGDHDQPSPGRGSQLSSVAAGPGGAAWAVGYYCSSGCGTGPEVDRPLILRWEHNAWSAVPSPSPGDGGQLSKVAVGLGGAAWAVGYYCASGCGGLAEVDRPLILRWEHNAWSAVPIRSPGQSLYIADVAAGPGGAAWAVGYYCMADCGTGSYCTSGCGSSLEVDRPLILQWEHNAWSAVPSHSPGRGGQLSSVAAGPGGAAWAVGSYCASGCGTIAEVDLPLILRWERGAWVSG